MHNGNAVTRRLPTRPSPAAALAAYAAACAPHRAGDALVHRHGAADAFATLTAAGASPELRRLALAALRTSAANVDLETALKLSLASLRRAA